MNFPFVKTGVSNAFFGLLGNSLVLIAWSKSCCNVSTVTIALAFNTFGGIFLWAVAFLTL